MTSGRPARRGSDGGRPAAAGRARRGPAVGAHPERSAGRPVAAGRLSGDGASGRAIERIADARATASPAAGSTSWLRKSVTEEFGRFSIRERSSGGMQHGCPSCCYDEQDQLTHRVSCALVLRRTSARRAAARSAVRQAFITILRHSVTGGNDRRVTGHITVDAALGSRR